MSRIDSLIKNSFILTLGTILPKLMTFLTLPIMTAYLTKVEYGTYDLILTAVSLIIPVASLQIEQAVFRFLIDSGKDRRRTVISTSLLFTVFAATILSVVGAVVLSKFQTSIKYLICSYTILSMFYQYFLQVLRGLKLLHLYSFAAVVNSLLSLFLIIVFVRFLDWGLYGLLISMNMALLISIIGIALKSKLHKIITLSSISISKLKKMLFYSSPMLPNSISWWVVGLSNRWVITLFLSIESAAIFAVANKIPSLFNLTYNAFNLSWQESASVSISDEDSNEYYSDVFDHLSNFLFGILYLLISLSPILFHLFIDETYAQAYYLMSLLFIGVLFHSYASFYGGLYIALKKTSAIGISSVIGATISLVVNISLITKIGLHAAAISVILSYLTIAIYRAFGIMRHIKIAYNLKKLALLMFVLMIISCINYFNHIFMNLFNVVLSCTLFFFLNRRLIMNFRKMLIMKFKK